ncbi:MAG: DUF981 family protein [Ornithinimicrobium sp.]
MTTLPVQDLTIDWASGPTYNTVMSLTAGVGLLLIVDVGRRLRRDEEVGVEGFALAFGILGALLTTTGLHMTLTWPLAPIGFAFDNIIFGEPALVFGVVLLGATAILIRNAPILSVPSPQRYPAIARLMGPTSVLSVFIGLACFAIAAAGVWYQLWVAPPQEPISGYFAQWPWVEITFIAGLYSLTGLGCVLLPLAVRDAQRTTALIVGVSWAVAGVAFAGFGALNYFTHIGLIINTSP